MSANEYLKRLLATFSVNTNGAKAAGNLIFPILERWGNGYLITAKFSGSLAKGTGISISTDADIFLSLSSSTPDTLANMYLSLNNAVAGAGYVARKQDVSIGITVNGYEIDLVPAKRQSQYGSDHSLYRNTTGRWTLTNIDKHINYVSNSGRIDEIRLLKLWRIRHRLRISSFYLELLVIDALRHARYGDIAANVLKVLRQIQDKIDSARYVDPANTNNVVSDDCTRAEKMALSAQASESLSKKTWQEIVW